MRAFDRSLTRDESESGGYVQKRGQGVRRGQPRNDRRPGPSVFGFGPFTGASTVEISGSSPGDIGVRRGVGYALNVAIGHAGQFNAANGQQNSWVAPATPQARAAAAKKAQELKRGKQQAAGQQRAEEQRQRQQKDQEHHWWQFWR